MNSPPIIASLLLVSLRAAAGECQIIAVGSSEANEDVADVPAVMLRYYGRKDIPLRS